MDFRVLGPLEVVANGHPLDLGPPKQRSVLAALLLRANEVVSLDRLIDDLWGAEPPPAATGSLQAYIANLRRILEPDRPPRTPSQTLISQAPGYLLRVAPADLDAARFMTSLAEGRGQLSAGQADTAAATLAAALGMWRGHTAYIDVEQWDFAEPEITRLAELRLAGQELHAEALLAAGRSTEAIPGLERLVNEAPLRERPRELLALALYRTGRQADALQLVADTRRLLVLELGIEPGPALQRLQVAMLAHDPTLLVETIDAAPRLLPTVGDSGADGVGPVERFVGRTGPLQTGREVLERARSGRGQILLIVGEPGIGKTTLAAELIRRAAHLGFAVGAGVSPETPGVPAFWPWTAVAEQLRAAFGDDRFDQLVREAGPHLAGVLSAGGAVEVASPADAAAPPSRFLACEAATRLLTRLAADRPLLVLLDDVQWADAPTVELVGHLAGQLTPCPLVLVLCLRHNELDPSGPVAALMARLARQSSVSRVNLSGLGVDEVAELMAIRAGEPVDEAIADAVQARTGGNPFFVSEMTRLLVSEGRLANAATTEHGVPDSVRDVVQQRVRRLPEQAVTLLAVAAVIGPEFDLEVLQRATGLADDSVVGALEAPVVTGLVIEVPDRPGRYRFVHALVRETVYEQISAPQRNRLHGRAVEVLTDMGREGSDQILAEHAWQAGAAVPAERALALTLTAADRADATFAYELAITLFRRAQTILAERMPAGPDRDEQEITVCCRLGRLLGDTRAQSTPEVAEAYGRALVLARLGDRPGALGEALWGLWANHCLRAAYDEADDLAAEIMALADRTGADALRVAALHAYGAVAFQRGRFADADRVLSDAVRLGSAYGDALLADAQDLDAGMIFGVALTVSSYGVLSMTRQMLGAPEADVTGLRDQALRLARLVDRPVVRAYALFGSAQLAVLQRRPDHARHYAAEAIDLCRRYGFRLWLALCEVYAGWAAAQRGELDLAPVRTAADRIDAMGNRMLRTVVLGLYAELQLLAGDRAGAETSLAAARHEAAETGEEIFTERLADLERRLE